MRFDIADWLRLAGDCLDRARVKRTRGDALRKLGKIEEAKGAYRAAARDLDEALVALPEELKREILEMSAVEHLDKQQRKVVDELVELYGSRGGIYRRSEDHLEALASYEQGSIIEQRLKLESTYNRLNAIKYKILAKTATLDEMEHDLKELGHFIDEQLAINTELSDSGWAWADLGDCQLLAGDFEGARSAYRTFVSKAETKSPKIALSVLADVSRTLESATGEKAAQAVKNIERLKCEFA